MAQTLYMNGRLSSSLYGGSGWEMSPRRRRRSLSQSLEQLEGVSSTKGTTPHTPYSPSMEEDSLDLLFHVKLVIGQLMMVQLLIYPLSYRVPVRERYGSTLLPATREQHDQNCTQSH